uniref:Uncharacterized protein n=1 Tax=Leersia perrieri TaxID=77586 RepID=A0A0D9W2L0_9ORYZ
MPSANLRSRAAVTAAACLAAARGDASPPQAQMVQRAPSSPSRLEGLRRGRHRPRRACEEEEKPHDRTCAAKGAESIGSSHHGEEDQTQPPPQDCLIVTLHQQANPPTPITVIGPVLSTKKKNGDEYKVHQYGGSKKQ